MDLVPELHGSVHESPDSLGQLIPLPLNGTEEFHEGGKPLGFLVGDFWSWSVSDLMSNATRGRLAEFIVANALGILTGTVRDEWGAYDLVTTDGIRIEVKSAAYLQSWQQRQLSTIQFQTKKTLAWDRDTNRQAKVARRQAHVYVFALLAHKDKETVNPLNLDQWEFYALPTSVLDERRRSQHSITLKSLQGLDDAVKYGGLRSKVEKCSTMTAASSKDGD